MNETMKRKKYLRDYYQKNKKRLSKINVESNKRMRKQNPWLESFYKLSQRCNNNNNKDYHRYGGRGIKALISKEEMRKLWFRDKAYEMKQPTIDRKNNDGDYKYDNCQWLENSENSRKRHKIINIAQHTLDGKLIKIWKNQANIVKQLKYNQSHLSRAINNNRIAYGYKWRKYVRTQPISKLCFK